MTIWPKDSVGSKVVGAIEVYRQPTTLFQALSASTFKVWLGAATVATGLYGVLFALRRATSVMDRQQRRLLETESLATVGEMASAVAHGLPNSLASIRLSAELAIECDDDAEIKELLGDITSQSDRPES